MKNIIYIITLILTTSVVAQTSTSVELENKKMKLALTYNDNAAAAYSLISIIALEGPQSTYKDSLAYLYYNAGNNISCFLVIEDVLKTKPGNLELLEMKAISLESMGALDKAKEAYETLFSKTNKNYHGYKLAGIQMAMNKNEEAFATIKKTDKLPDIGDVKITFQVNKNYNQEVNLKAAIAYLEGIIALNLEKKIEAKLSFERAVKLFPDFTLAKSKLTTMNAEK
ncbi:hypothetical protein [Lutibacter sp.]|uniref:tetratricopeptide repeat protein n=1 Tax=Lutibacter sp. TaxID=1925666 RepID=UPI0027344051|nr:hypothetical protein [Lutibacter sp.]MDP3311868.1 hypothetical protein [Lutibacter sp.]